MSSFELDKVLELWPSGIIDYGDAVISHYALKLNIPVITFDQKLIKQMKIIKIYLKYNLLLKKDQKRILSNYVRF